MTLHRLTANQLALLVRIQRGSPEDAWAKNLGRAMGLTTSRQLAVLYMRLSRLVDGGYLDRVEEPTDVRMERGAWGHPRIYYYLTDLGLQAIEEVLG